MAEATIITEVKPVVTETKLASIASGYAKLESTSATALHRWAGHLAAIADSIKVKGEVKKAYATIGAHCAIAVGRKNPDGTDKLFSDTWVSLHVNAWQATPAAPTTPEEAHAFKVLCQGNSNKAGKVRTTKTPSGSGEPKDSDEDSLSSASVDVLIRQAVDVIVENGTTDYKAIYKMIADIVADELAAIRAESKQAA